MKRGQYNKLNPLHFDFGKSLRKEFGLSSFNRLVRQYKANAKRRGLEFSLSDDEIKSITSSNCTYCGIESKQIMKNKDAYGHYVYNGIDRKDASKGYVIDNCTSCCKTCNTAKTNMSQNDWTTWINRLIEYNNDKCR